MRAEGRIFLPSALCPLPCRRQFLLRLLVRRVLPAEPAVLAQLEALGRLLAILRRAVIPSLTFGARERDDVSHKRAPGFRLPATGLQPEARRPKPAYSTISVIVPAPTVRPPSRIAKREPFSIATGVMSSPLMSVLSPGITISTPSGRWSEPVTSVVRM